jgi:hypothetical protein
MKNRIIGILITAIIVAQFVLIFIPERVNAVTAWYNSAWLYRKQFTVTGSTAGAQTNYQIKLNIMYGAGADMTGLNQEPATGTYAMDAGTGATTIVDAQLTSAIDGYYVGCTFYNVTRSLSGTITAYVGATKTATCTSVAAQANTDTYYIIGRIPTIFMASKCQTDFDDLRFSNSTGTTLLDAWLESKTDSSIATVWVELDSLPASPATALFYIYYGNAAATSSWSGANTFQIFDDFERGVNGDNVGGSWTSSGAGQVIISTDHNTTVGGTRSAKILGSVAGLYNMTIPVTVSPYIGISSQNWKENAATFQPFAQSNGIYDWYITVNTTEDILSSGVDTTYNMTPDAWVKFESFNINFVVPTWTLLYNNVARYNGSMTAPAMAANIIRILDINSGVGNDEYIDDFFVRKYCNPEPLVTTLAVEEIYATWIGTVLTIQDVKVFQNYLTSGDWLIAIRYIDIYAPYYDTYDVRRYFVFQLVDSVGNIKAQTVVPRWGNSVGNIYLDPTVVTSLTYGGTYYVKIYGLVSPNPNISYTIQSSDWIGVDLTVLDSWVISSASVLSTYYGGTAFTTYIADRGEVLNAQGATIFTNGINGLAKVRPSIFQTYSATGQGSGTPTQAGKTAINAIANLGPDATAFLTRLSNSFLGGLSLDWVVLIIFICLAVFIISIGFSPGHTPAAVLVAFIVVLGGVVFGVNIIYIVVAAIIFAFMLVKQFIMDK